MMLLLTRKSGARRRWPVLGRDTATMAPAWGQRVGEAAQLWLPGCWLDHCRARLHEGECLSARIAVSGRKAGEVRERKGS